MNLKFLIGMLFTNVTCNEIPSCQKNTFKLISFFVPKFARISETFPVLRVEGFQVYLEKKSKILVTSNFEHVLDVMFFRERSSDYSMSKMKICHFSLFFGGVRKGENLSLENMIKFLIQIRNDRNSCY